MFKDKDIAREYFKQWDQMYKRYIFRVKKDNKKIIKKLESVDSVNAYILSLIEKDIRK